MKKTKAFEQTDFNSTVAHQRDSHGHLGRLTALPAVLASLWNRSGDAVSRTKCPWESR